MTIIALTVRRKKLKKKRRRKEWEESFKTNNSKYSSNLIHSAQVSFRDSQRLKKLFLSDTPPSIDTEWVDLLELLIALS